MEFRCLRHVVVYLILVLICGCGRQDADTLQGGDSQPTDEWKQCRASLESVGANLGRGSTKYESWLKEKKVPDELAKGLVNCTLKEPVSVSAIRLYSEVGILAANSSEAFPIALQGGFLMLGTCPNGDPVVIDIAGTKGSVGYLCGETMWQAKDVRTEYVAVAKSFATFVQGLSQDHLPIDSFEAKEAKNK